MATPFIGEIRMAGFNFAPQGWATCDGQLVAISQNNALFALLGTTFGGDGVTTFGLPDMRSRLPIHNGQGQGLSPYVLGQVGGVENVALTVNQMPQHNHLIPVGTAPTTTNPANAFLANAPGGALAYLALAAATPTAMNANSVQVVGGSQPHPNLQPYLCVNFIIALEGVFPSRN